MPRCWQSTTVIVIVGVRRCGVHGCCGAGCGGDVPRRTCGPGLLDRLLRLGPLARLLRVRAIASGVRLGRLARDCASWRLGGRFRCSGRCGGAIRYNQRMGEWIERLVRKFAAFKADAEQLVVVLDEVSAPMQSRATFLAQPDRSPLHPCAQPRSSLRCPPAVAKQCLSAAAGGDALHSMHAGRARAPIVQSVPALQPGHVRPPRLLPPVASEPLPSPSLWPAVRECPRDARLCGRSHMHGRLGPHDNAGGGGGGGKAQGRQSNPSGGGPKWEWA